MRLVVPLLLVVSLVALSSCALSSTTPVDPLGDPVDLRPYLPADVAKKAPADSQATHYEAEVSLDQVSDPPAKLWVRWNAFQDSSNAYLLSYTVEVVESAPGVELALVRPTMGSIVGSSNITPGAPWVAATNVYIQCHRDSLFYGGHLRNTFDGSVTFQIVADGTLRQ